MKSLIKYASSIIATLFLSGAFFAAIQPAWAQINTQLDLKVDAAATYVWVKPGETKTVSVTVSQSGSQVLQVTPRLVDFYPAPITGDAVLAETSSFPYLTLETSGQSFGQATELAPGDNQQYTFAISPPADMTEGEYLQTVLFSGANTRPFQATGADSVGVIGSHLIIAVSTEPPTSGGITIASVGSPTWIDSLWPLQWDITLENTGRFAQKIFGETTITNWQDEVVYEQVLAEESVLGFSQRQARPQVDTNAVNEIVSPDSFMYNPVFAIGPHTLTVTVRPAATASATLDPVQFQRQVIFFPFSIFFAVLAFMLLYATLSLVRSKNSLLSRIRKTITVNEELIE